MPKKYPVEVRLFAIQKKTEGHSWDRVAEMVRQNFGLDPPPSRRQMTKWITTRDALSEVVMQQINRRLPKFAPEWLSTKQGALLKVIAEILAGKDFGIVMAKWMFSQFEELLGPQRLRTAWTQFTEEEERSQRGSDEGLNLQPPI